MSKTIAGISEATHKRFLIFKIQTGSKNSDEALLKLLVDANTSKVIPLDEEVCA